MFFSIKKIFKFFKFILITIFLLLIILFVTAKVKENEITEIVLEKITDSTHIPIAINDISLNLIRRFPYATITLEDVWIGNCTQDSMYCGNDTLAYINKVYVSVRSVPLFKGNIEIMKIEIKGISFNFFVNREGVNNLSFIKNLIREDNTQSEAVIPSILLKELQLKDVQCNYSDSMNMVQTKMMIPKIEIHGEIKNDYLFGAVKGNLKLSDCDYKTSKLCLMKETEIRFDIRYSEDSVDLKKVVVSTDGADIYFNGKIVVKDTIETDIQVQAEDIDLGELVKYIPDNIVNELKLEKISGSLDAEASVKGNIYNSNLPEVIINLNLKKSSIQFLDLPFLEKISFSAFFTNGELKNNTSSNIILKNFHAESEPGSVDLSLSVTNLDHIKYSIKSDIDFNIEAIKNYIPDSIFNDISGNISASVKNTGIIPDTLNKEYINDILKTCEFNLKLDKLFIKIDSALTLDSLSGNIAYNFYNITARELRGNLPEYHLNINNASLDAGIKGNITDLSKAEVNLRSYHISTDSSTLFGSLKVHDFEKPEFTIASDIKINLGEIKPFVNLLINDVSGEVTGRIVSKGKLNPDSITSQINDIVFNNSEFSFDLYKISTAMKDTLYNVKDLSGKIFMKPDSIRISNVNGIYQGVYFNIDSTIVANLYNSVFKKQSEYLNVTGMFNLGDMDYSLYAPFMNRNKDTINISTDMNDTKPSHDSVTKPGFSYLIKGKFGAKSLTYKNARIDNITGLFRISDSMYIVDQFKFEGFGGRLNTSVKYEIRDGNENILWVKNSIEKLNVNRLLKDFDNFKEFYKPAITYKNISGILSSNFDAKINFEDNSVIRKKIYVRADNIKLEKGIIYHYQPVKDMEQYLPGIDNLDILEFKTINSGIFVFQDTVYVPSTFIVSNKLDASALGLQTLGGDYSYHFKVFISDILYSKNEKIKRKQDKIGNEISIDDRKGGTLVKSYSIDGKSKSGLDNKDDQARMELNVKTSNTSMKLKFNPYIINYDTGLK